MFGSNVNKTSYANRMCAESFWAYLQLIIPIRNLKKGLPMLVMGGQEDQLISVLEYKQTAKAYGAQLALVEGGSHDLMLDSNGKIYLDLIHAWLKNPA